MVVGVVLRAADTFFQASTAALSVGIPQLGITLGRTGLDSWPNWTCFLLIS